AAEHRAFSQLFARGSPLVLEQTNHQVLSSATTTLQQSLAETYKNRLFHGNGGWSALGVLLAAVLAIIVAALAPHTYGELGQTMVIGGIFAIIGIAMGAGDFGMKPLIGIPIALILMAVGLLVGLGAENHWTDALAMIPPLLAAGLAARGFYLLKA